MVMQRIFRLLVVVVLCLGSQALAGKHPVPLDKNADAASCLKCHEQKTKGAAVHSAMATGCLSCHEVRVNGDVTRIKLTTTTTSALCLTCHDAKNTSIAGGAHPPAVRDCLTCHDPHSSPNKFQLKKASSGDKAENLCLSCHAQGLNVPKDGSRHAALDMGCETCHVTHKTGDKSQREFKFHLTKASPALCLDCHDTKDQAIVTAHRGQPVSGTDCLTCHDPHASKQAKLMQKFTHMPFAEKSCDTCHAEPKEGKVVLTQADSRALCLTCHEDKAKLIETAKVQHPGAQGECITCHDPHAGSSPAFLRPDPVTSCTNCHADQAEMHKTKKVLHQPAFEQGCATCHEPHGGSRPKLLRADSSALCLECHGPNASPQRVEGQNLMAIFNGKVRVPGNYFRRVPVLPIKYGLGHPVEHHPVVDQMQPDDVSKVRVSINCMTCHQPHGSAQPNLLVKDQATGIAFCATCHKNMGPQ